MIKKLNYPSKDEKDQNRQKTNRTSRKQTVSGQILIQTYR